MNDSPSQAAPRRKIICPSADRWRAYAVGELSEDWINLLGDHLETCQNCEATLAIAEADTDSQLHGIRAALDVTANTAHDALADVETLVERVLANNPFSDTANAADGTSPTETCESPLAVGSRLGPYTLLEKVGEGGMGVVFKARHEHTKREVALKLLSKQRELDAGAMARFRREMEAAGQLEHRQVVQALDAGEIDGQAYLAMEFVRGETFAQRIAREGRIAPATACRWITEVAKVLRVLHGRGIVHRDLKPSNLMLHGNDEIKILDLGLIRLLDTFDGEQSSTGTIVGTADYIAPEQSLESRAADARSDIYSLGCTFYCLLHGRPPFDDPRYTTFTQKALAHVQVLPERLDRLHADISAELATIVARMLAKEPGDRYQSAAEVVEALAHVAIDEERIVEATPVGEAAPHAKPTKKKVSWWWMIPTATAAIAAVAFFLWRPDRSLPEWDIESEQAASNERVIAQQPQPQPAAPQRAPRQPIAQPAVPPQPPARQLPPPPRLEQVDASANVPEELAAVGKKVVHWPIADGGNGHYYVLSAEQALWTDAKTLAEKLAPEGYRSYLVSVTSPEENVLVANRVLGFSPAWIGLTDDEDHGGSESEQAADPTRDGWHWLSGEPVDYVSWGPGRPQHVLRQDYVFMYSGGAWDDGNNFALPFIVEVEKLVRD